MNPFAFGLLAAAACFISQRSHASTIPITGPDTVEYKKLAEVGRWQPLTGPTPGGGGVIFRSAGVADAVPKVSNLRLEQAGKAVDVKAAAKVPLGTAGKTVEVLAKARVTGAMYARGVGAVLGGPLGLTLLAYPLLVDLINETGDFRVNPANGDLQKALTNSTNGMQYRYGEGPWGTAQAACARAVSYFNDIDQGTGYSSVLRTCNPPSDFTRLRTGPFDSTVFSINIESRTSTETGSEWRTATMDELASRMDQPDSPPLTPEVLQEGAKTGVDPFGAAGPQVEVSGPSSVAGGTTTTTTPTRVNEGTTIEASPSTNAPTQPATKTTTTTTNHNVTYNDNKVTYNTVTNNTTNITNNVTNQTETTPGEEKVEEGESPEEEEAPTDTALPPVPNLYERKYPDGLVGIWNQKSEQIKQTSTFTLAKQLMPTGFTSGSCPSWVIPLNFASWAGYGEHNFAPPCWIWDVAKTIIIISALMLARSLIFGG